jgi:pilus assembly protein CpaB
MRRPIVFVLLAGVAALVAALVVYSALKKREAQVREAMAQTVEIVVAAHDLPLGTKIDESSVKMARWSRDSMPPGAFTSPQAVMNAYVKSSLVENEPIVADRLFVGDKTAGVMPLLIPAGMRAMSVPVDEVSDIAGFVLPHSHVDVLVAVGGGPQGGTFSKVVLENVEVLAVAQEIEKTKDQPQVVKVVTFLVTPEEAERLTLASREGTLRLAMRNYDDKKVVFTPGATVQQMLRAYTSAVPVVVPQQRAVAHAPAVRPRPKPVQVEVMRNGRTAESVSFIRNGAPQMEREETSPPGDTSSSIDRSTKTAKAAEKPAEGSRGLAKAETLKSEGPTTTATTAAVPSEVALNPKSKTIDVPSGWAN